MDIRVRCVCMFCVRPPESPHPSHDTSFSLVMESGLRVFFIVTPDDTDGPCKYIVLCKFLKVKWAGHSQQVNTCTIAYKLKKQKLERAILTSTNDFCTKGSDSPVFNLVIK